MRMLQSILLATDFLPGMEDVGHAAVHLASAFASRVTLFHALDPAENRDRAAANMRALAEQLSRQKVVVDKASLAIGSAADATIRKAQEIDADLILIGAGEETRHSHPAGPVAQTIIQRAFQPVLAIRREEPVLEFRRILCPVDSSPVSRGGLENAIRLARTFASNLIVLSVVPEDSQGKISVEQETNWREEFNSIVQGFDFGNVAWQKEVRMGRALPEILKAAQDHRTDLIVMGSYGRSGHSLVLLGSVTRRVLQRLPCSLLAVKHEDVIEDLLEKDIRSIRQLMHEGRELLAVGHYAEAAGQFRQVLVHNPFLIGALENLAAAYTKLNRTEEALRYQRRAAALRQ
jgi:universal stress protein E